MLGRFVPSYLEELLSQKCFYFLKIVIYLYTSNILQIRAQAMLYLNT